MTRVTLGKSRVREIRPPGSVRAKAEWLSYSTTTQFDPDDARKLEIFFSARTQRLMREAGISET
jgi:hypothetical protein